MLHNSRRLGLPLIMFLLVAALAVVPAHGEGYLSPQDLAASRDGKALYISEVTAHKVAVYDTAADKLVRQIELPAAPGGLALSADDKTLYVTGAAPAGEVYVIDAAAGTVTAKIAVGHTPLAPVPSPDGKTLYVCNRFNNNVSVIDLAAGKEVAKIAVIRDPMAAAITPDGATLFVANLLPDGPATADVVAASVSVIDLKTRQPKAAIQLPNGSTALHGICLSPDGKYAYITHTLGRYQLPTTQLERGWMNTNALSIIDVAGQKLVNTVLLDDVDLGAANPWGVACTADGRLICVAHAGTHELSLIDRPALHEKLDKVAAGQRVNEVTASAADVPNDLSFLVGLRRRVKMAGLGPRGLAVIGAKAYAAEYFSDSVGIARLSVEAPAPVATVALAPAKTPMTAARKGELFFNDASLCFQQWQSCVSCHPDARTDALNWDLLNDGIGNPKNSKSMLLTHDTPPVMSLGVRENAEYAVRSGIKFIQFAVRPEEDAKAIDAYLKSLKPVPSPYLTREGKLSAAAERGKGIFEKAGCSMCHSGQYFTSLKSYDLGTATGIDKGKAIDTPTLIEAWRTAPYLHDGRSKTIKDVLTTDNPGDQHGSTKDLTKDELSDLIEYVLSL